MLKIREVAGVRLKDGRMLRASNKEMRDHGHVLVMYDEGVQIENDNGCTLYTWDEIFSVEI